MQHGSSFFPSRSPSTALATSGESSGGAPQIEQMYSNSVRPLTPPVLKKSRSTGAVPRFVVPRFRNLAAQGRVLGGDYRN